MCTLIGFLQSDSIIGWILQSDWKQAVMYTLSTQGVCNSADEITSNGKTDILK